MKPTVTPVPSIPSLRAVGSDGLSESAWMSESASGSSCTCPGLPPHRPALAAEGKLAVWWTFLRVWVCVKIGASRIAWSGMTSLTAGLDFSRLSSAPETVAEIALINV